MEAWIIYDKFEAERNKEYIQLYFEECNKRNIDLRLLLAEDINIGVINNKCTLLYNNEKQAMPCFVICRIANPLLSKQFELMGIPVFNCYEVSMVCNDKQKTYQYLSHINIKIMDTIFTDKNYCKELYYPSIIKPANGKGGKDVYLVRNDEELKKTLAKMPDTDIVIQKAASDLGRDLRVYVIGKRIVAGILRISDTDFRSNYCLGGSAVLYDLNKEEKTIINKIIDMFNFGFVGIDFVFDKGKIIFNEIEDVVGSRMLFAKTKINVVSEYIDHIIKKV